MKKNQTDKFNIKLKLTENDMTIEEKYKILIVDGKRYYQFDMAEKLPILDDTIPYYFKYEDVEIYESAWNRMALKIVEELDKKFPRSESWYLGLNYDWSKTDVFSQTKQTNFSKFKNIYLNTNHTSTHAMMSIQYILRAFHINLNECYFLIRRHPSAEPKEAREYYRNKTISDFSNALKFRNKPDERVAKIINNFTVINKILSSISGGFDDFFLFDDYYYFTNYKIKVHEAACKKFYGNQKNIDVVDNMLNYLDNFYKNRKFYEKVCDSNVSFLLKPALDKEINYLFDSLDSTTIVYSKLFARMNIMHEKIMNKLDDLNNAEDVYRLAEAYLGKRYYFKYPLIAKDQDSYMTNDQIIMNFIETQDQFSIDDINDFADKSHLSKPNNYLKLISDLSDRFVQVSQDTMVKKEALNLNADFIDKIKNEISYYIKSFGKINTIKYKGYESLPKVGAKWNKFLLAGIVRSYLLDCFKITCIGNTYKTVEFEIDLLK